jgi:hypothetical protein
MTAIMLDPKTEWMRTECDQYLPGRVLGARANQIGVEEKDLAAGAAVLEDHDADILLVKLGRLPAVSSRKNDLHVFIMCDSGLVSADLPVETN